ncbi:MAG: hypothetical protein NTY86_01020 [Deltaproteobacteria bacterium]|nr:hypothetical protein [Deltaproteobacteria bacterium]
MDSVKSPQTRRSTLTPFLVLAVVHKFYTEKRELLILNMLKAQPIVPIEEQGLTIA